MKAVVFRGVGDIRLDDVPDPDLQQATDAVVRLTMSAICGTDLHMVRGTVPGMRPGTVLGHEGVGVIEKVGSDVRNLNPGDRVVIPSTLACGYCAYCRAGYFSQCDTINPHGSMAGTAFYGGPEETGSFPGLQAQKARIPMASVNLIKLPDDVSDDDAILISDIVPTGWFAADLAEVKSGRAVAVFGCGPVGQFAIASALRMDAGRIFAVDTIPSRLEMARAQGAEVIDYQREDPIETIRRLTGGIGVDRAIDAVGVDANAPHGTSNGGTRTSMNGGADGGRKASAGAGSGNGNDSESAEHWQPGDAPSQVLEWAVEALAKAGTFAIVGVYPKTQKSFPIGVAMNKNLTIRSGNCNHRRYIPRLVRMVQAGTLVPSKILTQIEPLTSAIEAYRAFDQRRPGWMKVELAP